MKEKCGNAKVLQSISSSDGVNILEILYFKKVEWLNAVIKHHVINLT